MPGLKLELQTTRHGEFFFFPVLQANSIFDPLKVPRFTVTAGGQTMKSARNIARPSIGNRHRIGKRRAAAGRGKMGFLVVPSQVPKSAQAKLVCTQFQFHR